MELKKDLETQRDVLKKSIRNYLRLAWACIALAVLLFVFYAFCPFLIYNLFPINTHDYAIAIPVLLASIAGVFFVYIAFLGQRWQMLYQQQEIRDNRQEMEKSRKELNNQYEALNNQIRRMDRDFVNQNFFRILEQHFKTRDRLTHEKLEIVQLEFNSPFYELKKYTGEETFKGLFKFLLKWIDDKDKGWHRKLINLESELFEREHGFKWIDKNIDCKISRLPNLKLIPHSDDFKGLSEDQIQFIFRYILFEGSFDPYIRSTFHLLDYVKQNNLTNYFKAIESGMGNEERIFMFYFLTTQFDLYKESDLKNWLMENNFLYSIKENDLLDMEHKILLYPKEGDLPIPYL